VRRLEAAGHAREYQSAIPTRAVSCAPSPTARPTPSASAALGRPLARPPAAL